MKATYCDKTIAKAQKLVSVVLVVLVATVAMIPLSASAESWNNVPPVISVPVELPQLGYSTGNGVYRYRFCVECYYYTLPSGWSDTLNYPTYLYEIESSSPFSISYSLAPFGARDKTLLIFPSITSGITCHVTQILRTGNPSWSSPCTMITNNYGSYWFAVPCNGSSQWGNQNFVCYILDDGLFSSSSISSDYFIDTQFIQFAHPVPSQIQYRSSLPAPQWDIHNRYIVIDDKLYWISYYIDNLWINPITGSATVSSDDHTAVVTGNASDPTDGDIYYNYNVSIRYQDKDYYCLQYNSVNYSNETMCAPCLVYTSSGSRLTISFDQLSGIYSSISDILVDYRIYCSSFDLITGEYIESIYAANGQQGNAEININLDCPDEISSVYCYGVDFVNAQNLPVNLASVIWSYDLEFASWRTDISSKLDAIYALLSQSSVPSTTSPVDYASMLNPEPTVSGYNAEDAGSLLAGAVSDVNVELGDGMEWGRNQLNDFATGVPELFLVVILALAFGLTIMILGKKKSDN